LRNFLIFISTHREEGAPHGAEEDTPTQKWIHEIIIERTETLTGVEGSHPSNSFRFGAAASLVTALDGPA
jgi:hypothetical protein